MHDLQLLKIKTEKKGFGWKKKLINDLCKVPPKCAPYSSH